MKAVYQIVCVLASVAVFGCALLYVGEAWNLVKLMLALGIVPGLKAHWLISGWSGDLAYQLGRLFSLILPGVGIWGFGRLAHYCGVRGEM